MFKLHTKCIKTKFGKIFVFVDFVCVFYTNHYIFTCTSLLCIKIMLFNAQGEHDTSKSLFWVVHSKTLNWSLNWTRTVNHDNTRQEEEREGHHTSISSSVVPSSLTDTMCCLADEEPSLDFIISSIYSWSTRSMAALKSFEPMPWKTGIQMYNPRKDNSLYHGLGCLGTYAFS